MGVAGGALHAELSDRALGRRVDADAGAAAPGRARDREPARIDGPPGESVVCDPGGRQPDENAGEVWFGALAWSGSWRITVEQDQLDAVRVTGGFNPFDFGYVLQPGQKLETPVFYGGYQRARAWAALRGLLHQFEIAHVLPHRLARRAGLRRSRGR